MEVMEAIKGRRSVRKYKPDAVRKEDLQAVLEAARWAPSWSNTQCWRFIVVQEPGMKAKLAGVLTTWNPAAAAIREAPVVVVACAELGRSGIYKGEAVTAKGDWYMFDAGLAMQNLMLAAHSLGLGTVHVGAFDDRKAAEILGVPEGFVVVEMTPLGYPAAEPRAPARKELSELVFSERWGQKGGD